MSTHSQSQQRRALSLVEIMVSISLMAFLLTAGTQAFVQMRTFTRRTQAKQSLHNVARIIAEHLRTEISSLQHNSACYLISHDGTGGQARGVEMIFLRGKIDTFDFTRLDSFGEKSVWMTDLVWSRWHWDADRGDLAVAASSPARTFDLSVPWANGGISYQGQTFANLPTPRRDAGTGPLALDANAYGSGDPEDYGDYQDLIRQSVPIAQACSGLRIEWVLHDGSTVAVDGSANAVIATDGVFVDGRITTANAKRPQLIRILLDLTDAETKLTETFAFSFQTPGQLPL